MKKKVYGVQGLQGCAKARPLHTFMLTLFLLVSFIMLNKFTMKGQESDENAKPPQKLVLKHIATKLLTLPKTYKVIQEVIYES